MKLKYFIYILTLSLLFTSCGDFLEGRSLDKAIPNRIDHYKEIMMGEVYMISTYSLGEKMNHMTDDVDESSLGLYDESEDGRDINFVPWYQFAVETQLNEDAVENSDKSWNLLYKIILTCNIIESEVGDLDEDQNKEKYTLIAEAQVMRAIAYWHLVTMYGEIYKDAATAEEAFGVPINREAGIKDKIYERSTLAENYALMEKDLLSSLENFDKGLKYKTKFRPNANVARLFLTRIYLNMKQWDKVIKYSDEFFANTDAEIVPLDIIKEYKYYAVDATALYGINNPGIFFIFGTNSNKGQGMYANANSYRFRPSKELTELYGITMEESNTAEFREHFEGIKDIRGKRYFVNMFGIIKPMKFGSSSSDPYASMAYRIEEMYYNKAEALLEKEQHMAAIDLVNVVRLQRIDDVNYKLVPSNAAEAKQMFRDDKRREFCFEDLRWNDLRRWEIPVTHTFQIIGGRLQKFTLKVGSPNWVLPLPLDLIKLNPIIELVEREDCLVGTV